MNKNIFKTSIIIASLLVYACKDMKKDEESSVKGKGIDIANFDTTINPCQNFYQYVNGNWLKNNPIPGTEGAWGSFNELREKTKERLKGLVEEAAADSNAQAGSNKQKIGDFYHTGMDSTKLEKDGVSPLNEEFSAITSVKNTKDLMVAVAHLHIIGMSPLFNFYVSQDAKNSEVMLSSISQGGIGLPDRDYYFKTDKTSEDTRKEYVIHIQKMFELLGDKSAVAAKEAKTVMDIESKLAKASRTNVQMRDVEALYNKKSLDDIKKLTPNVDWDTYLKNIEIQGVNEMNVAQPEFFETVNTILKTVGIDDWKTYLRWHLINGTAGKLNNDFVNEHFHFYGTILSGIKQLKPRWKRCLDATDNLLGEALGQLYVEKYFSADAKQRVNEMVDNLIAVYKERINTRDWMSPETKKQAIGKLDIVMRKLAYPDKWRDYSSLEIKRDSYVMNFLKANAFESKRIIARLGKPVDRTEWQMSPPTINAYYEPSMNEIVFPAGIMQPPFFDPEADDAVNYGCMGAVIGHELTHGFDDQGSQYDAKGNMKNWWTEEDKTKFKEKTQMVVKQFNNFIALDSLHVNGELTLGENIADLGGLTIAFAAYKKSLEGKTHPEKIDGLTAEQRFFISWGQGWRVNYRPESLRQQVLTNPHSPGPFRVNGPLSNMKEFYEAFGVKPGDAMYRGDNERAEIW